uniref:Interferon gamma n=1 Tax=Homo sapiens TaxID=9606 RepID=UPI00001117F7|nr:Chain A, Interferon gamma [Homo sapiens]1FYH_D Chain D, Interferon gamma [Homo sapiens]
MQDPYVKEAENLKKYFNAGHSDVADNGTLFLGILKNWKEESDRKIMQSQIVSFYFKLFKNFKDDQSIQKSVETIKEDMNVKFFNSNKKKRDDFEKLTNYSVTDLNVQRKAIDELIQVMAELGANVSGEFVKEAENLKKYFNAGHSDVADNGTLFLGILKNWKEESDRKIMQSQIVSFYFKLFKNFKDDQSIQKSVETIKEDMNVKFFNSNKKKRDDFEKLTNYSVTDLNVQRKAIHELIQVMAELSPAAKTGKRKRSQ